MLVLQYARRLAAAIDQALAASSAPREESESVAPPRRTPAQFVYMIEPLRAKSYYGYPAADSIFYKVGFAVAPSAYFVLYPGIVVEFFLAIYSDRKSFVQGKSVY